MGKQIRQIRWDQNVLQNFTDILDFIKLDSPTNAKKVKTRIVNLIKAIPNNLEMYREDELKSDNNGTFRVFNQDNIRVSYKIEPTAIIIARIKHSKQESISY